MREGSSLQNENKLQNGIVCVVALEKEDLERSKARKLVSAKPGGPGAGTSISRLGVGINGKSCRACPDPGPSWGPLGAGDTLQCLQAAHSHHEQTWRLKTRNRGFSHVPSLPLQPHHLCFVSPLGFQATEA